MDEIALLRRVRPDVAEPTPDALAHARARLLARTEQAPEDRADHLRFVGALRRRPYRVVAFAGVAAALATVFALAPFSGQQESAGAAGLLTEAADRISDVPAPSVGQFLKVTTRGEALSYVTGDDGQVTSAYVVRTVDETYVPADRDDEWVVVSYALPARTFYGDPSVRQLARRDYAQSAQADDPHLTRAAAGQLGNGELGGSPNSYATTADLPFLPRDPAALLDDLSARSDGAASSQGIKVMDQISTLLSSGLVDAELTASMYRTLALLPDVAITEQQTTLDDRPGTAIGVIDDERFALHEVVIDLDKGTFLGIRTRQVDTVGPIPAGTTIWSTATTSSVVSSSP